MSKRQTYQRQQFVPVIAEPGDGIGNVRLQLTGYGCKAFRLLGVLERPVQGVADFISIRLGLGKFILDVFHRPVDLLLVRGVQPG